MATCRADAARTAHVVVRSIVTDWDGITQGVTWWPIVARASRNGDQTRRSARGIRVVSPWCPLIRHRSSRPSPVAFCANGAREKAMPIWIGFPLAPRRRCRGAADHGARGGHCWCTRFGAPQAGGPLIRCIQLQNAVGACSKIKAGATGRRAWFAPGCRLFSSCAVA